MRRHSCIVTIYGIIIISLLTLLTIIMMWPPSVTASSHRSNTQQSLPHDHYLADMDGDGVDEFVITAGSSIFVTRTNFHTEGRSYTRTNATIRRAFTGDFIGAARSQACFILTTQIIACYIMDPPPSSSSSGDYSRVPVGERLRLVISNDASFIDDNDDLFVGDFDGDARGISLITTISCLLYNHMALWAARVAELLIFSASSGIFRVFKVSHNQFELQTKQQFDLDEVLPVTRAQAIINTALQLQIRVGNFDDSRVKWTSPTTPSSLSPASGNMEEQGMVSSTMASSSPSPSAFFHQMASQSRQITRQLLAVTQPNMGSSNDDTSWSSRLLSYFTTPSSTTNSIPRSSDSPPTKNDDPSASTSSLPSFTPRTDDLLIFDPSSGIVRIYETRVSPSTSQPTVFLLSVMTQTNFLAADDLVHVANIRGTVFDDIVVQSTNGGIHFFQGRLAAMTRGLIPLPVSIGPLPDWLNPNDSSDIPVTPATSGSSGDDDTHSGTDDDLSAAGQTTMPTMLPINPPSPASSPQNRSDDPSMAGVSAPSSSSSVQGVSMSTQPRLFFARLKQLSQPVVRPDPSSLPPVINDDSDNDDSYGATKYGTNVAGVSRDDLHALEGHPMAGELGVSPLWSPYAAAAGNSPFHAAGDTNSNGAGGCDNGVDYDRLCPNDHRSDAIVWRYGGGTPVWSVAVAAIRNQQRTFEWVYTQLVVQLDKDQDADSILTRYELGGLDQNEDGITDEPLHLYGASPFLQDVFVHVDYMQNTKKSMQPTDRARSMAVTTMAGVGINLHVLIGSAVPFVDNLGGVGQFNWENDFDPIKKKFFPLSRQGVFHYCLFANKHNGGTVSGRSRAIPGADFLITLGGWDQGTGTYEQQGGTLLHELGHNLNLRHGGSDNANYKPNHISIMNYLYQVSGILKDGKRQFLYSQLACETLNELSLNERNGITCRPGNGQRTTTGMVSHEIAAAATVAHSGGTALPTDVTPEMNIDQWRALIRTHNNWYDLDLPIDFNGNGVIEDSIVFDLNGDDADQLLLGAPDEYSILRFDGLGPLAVIPSINEGVDVRADTSITTSSSKNDATSFVVQTVHEKTYHSKDINSEPIDILDGDDPNDNEDIDEELSYTAYKKFRHIGSDQTARGHRTNTSSADTNSTPTSSSQPSSSSSSSLFQPLPSSVAMLRTHHYSSSSSSRVPIALRLPAGRSHRS